MRTRNAAGVVALCLGLSTLLTACGGGEDPDAGTNGVGKLGAAAIQDRAREAARQADAVHLSGNVAGQGRSYRLDMRLKKDGGTGRVASDTGSFELLRIGDDLFLKADAAFWSRGDGAARGAGTGAASKLDGKYVKVPTGDPAYRQLRGFTDKDVLLDGLLGLHGKLSRGAHGSVGGVPSIRVNGTDAKGTGGTLDVSLAGRPYPLRVRRAGGAGQVELGDWGKDFALSVPQKSALVDYGKRIPAGG
ncbi:hypothetical protein [Streptomyces orinoci]|uniref:Lipoprotein n=1 Tax=Streptomyces orinoci TaxID=67339 RepID=A0ABV3JSU4_STRON|nr:hypothetical protein [Streptomyces orinoci]